MKCENCAAEITFWLVLKQPTPFRFRCPKCRVKYKVTAPYMKGIFVGVLLLFAGLTVGLIAGSERFGILFFVPFLLIMIGAGLVLEVWTHKYISAKGQLTRMTITEPGTGSDSE